ncbi:Excinuclease ABC C subunit domain protein [Dehalogenimonas lykanthroporepellens BL-DC-9]|nr:Excinuclease ABC C subunit domain protein [Dehalogenimonas lykanthroporepellens BL-DC-9]
MSLPAKAGNLLAVSEYYVYLMASKPNGTLYIGVTNNLIRRVYEHKNDLADGFTKKYGIHTLVHFEQCNDILAAITREKQMKKWKRVWKIELIEQANPEWRDLYPEILG